MSQRSPLLFGWGLELKLYKRRAGFFQLAYMKALKVIFFLLLINNGFFSYSGMLGKCSVPK